MKSSGKPMSQIELRIKKAPRMRGLVDWCVSRCVAAQPCCELAGFGTLLSWASTWITPFRWASRGPIAVDEFVEHEFAFDHVVAGVVDLLGHAFEIFDLHAGQRFGRLATSARQRRMGIPPLIEFIRPLLLRRRQLVPKLFQQFVGAILRGQHFAQQLRLFLSRDKTGCEWVAVETSTCENSEAPDCGGLS